VKSTKIKRIFLSFIAAVFLATSLISLVPPSANAADKPGQVGGGCVGNVSTGASSPFKTTKDLCLGQGEAQQFYQFVVDFQVAVNDVTVTAKSKTGENIKFTKESATRWVSIDTDGDGMGYRTFLSTSSSACNKADGINIVDITAKANGQSQTLSVNLCSYTDINASVIYTSANTIKAEAGSGGGTTTPSTNTGTIKGNLGIYRTDQFVPTKWQKGTLEKDGVVSIKLSGGPSAKSGTNADTWYSLANGMLDIPDLKAGVYKLEIKYNDKVILQELGGSADWTADDMQLSWSNIVLPAGGEFWLDASSKDSVAYYNSTGEKVTIPKSEEADKTTSCVIDGVGWLVCTFANFLANVTDGIYGLIQNMLKVPVINTNINDGNNGVYNAWSIMRTFANVGFVIGFLIIIFSQITSLGVSNYGVKKTLPRLVIAAILVNVSYWLSAIAVDLSNIVGSGIYDIMSGIKDNLNVGVSANWGNIIGGLLGGTGLTVVAGVVTAAAATAVIASGGGMAIVFLALPLVLSAVLAVIVAALILIARQALVIILIVVSPLAFVALLLPNTEKLFDKWRSGLVSLLVMYPIISIIFGGAQIAGLTIMSSAVSTTDPTGAGLAIVMGQAVMVVPFFLLPMLITKFSGDNLKGIASAAMSKGKGLISGVSGASRKEGRSRMGRSLNTMKYGQGATNRLGGAVRKYGRKLDQIKDRHGMTDSMLAEERQGETRARLGTDAKYATAAGAGSYAKGQEIASRATAAAEAEELKKALQPLIRELAGMDSVAKDAHLAGKIAAGGTEAAAALHYSASIGDSGFMRKQLATAASTGNAELKRQTYEAINANSGALLGKAPDLVKGGSAAFGNVKGADLASFSKDTAQAYMEHLKSLTGAELTTALGGFNSAVEDITKSADLQSKFSGDTGTALAHHAGNLDPAVQAQMHGTAAIQSDGKIR
jgi:hypothetical protein